MPILICSDGYLAVDTLCGHMGESSVVLGRCLIPLNLSLVLISSKKRLLAHMILTSGHSWYNFLRFCAGLTTKLYRKTICRILAGSMSKVWCGLSLFMALPCQYSGLLNE